MKSLKNSLNMLLAVSLLISFTFFPACGKMSQKYAAGMKIAAKWSDGNYYMAVIKNVSAGKYDVDYADGSKGTVTEGEMKEIPARLNLKTGDTVIAVWSGAKFYPGIVQEVKPEGAVIKWNDGSAPSMVEFGKIIK